MGKPKDPWTSAIARQTPKLPVPREDKPAALPPAPRLPRNPGAQVPRPSVRSGK